MTKLLHFICAVGMGLLIACIAIALAIPVILGVSCFVALALYNTLIDAPIKDY